VWHRVGGGKEGGGGGGGGGGGKGFPPPPPPPGRSILLSNDPRGADDGLLDSPLCVCLKAAVFL
jgi:hypothetical protein